VETLIELEDDPGAKRKYALDAAARKTAPHGARFFPGSGIPEHRRVALLVALVANLFDPDLDF
jgi:hypothetical protein